MSTIYIGSEHVTLISVTLNSCDDMYIQRGYTINLGMLEENMYLNNTKSLPH